MTRLSLKQFVLNQKRAKCKVCALPNNVKAQLRGRDRRTAPVATVLAWLKEVVGVSITVQEFKLHTHERHDPGSIASR